MPDPPRPAVASAWTIRSVPVRTRDGRERLAQAYRRLLREGARETESPSADPLPTEAAERS